MGTLWEFLRAFSEFFEYRLASPMIVLVVFAMNRSFRISPRIKRFGKTVNRHSSHFIFIWQMLMVGQHIGHQITERLVVALLNKATIHQHTAGP